MTTVTGPIVRELVPGGGWVAHVTCHRIGCSSPAVAEFAAMTPLLLLRAALCQAHTDEQVEAAVLDLREVPA